MTSASRDSGDGPAQLSALTSRIGYLERELDRVTRTSATSAVLAASATLLLASLALPWSVRTGSSEFDASAVIGWSAFTTDAAGVAIGLVCLLAAGLTLAAATSQSAGMSLAAHIAAAWVGGVPLLLLLGYALSRMEVNRPAVGYYTALIALGSIAVTAAVRRRQLRS